MDSGCQRIRQHETPDFPYLSKHPSMQRHSPANASCHCPVFQIDVYGNAQFFGIIQRTTDVGLRVAPTFSLQLVRTMVFRTLTQQIDVFTPASMNPIQRSVSVYKPQNFHPVEPPGLARPLANATHCIHLPSDTRAEATSMRSTFRSCNSAHGLSSTFHAARNLRHWFVPRRARSCP